MTGIRSLPVDAAAERRHALTERLLSDVIGLKWSRVHEEAERWGDVVSDDVAELVAGMLGDPGTCAHGNPIPGSANVPNQSGAVRLADAPVGPIQVVRIEEGLEEDRAALELLEACGAIPGRAAEVLAHAADGVQLAGSRADAVVPSHVARGTWVQAR
jgi:DtxR family Mn-dependent transcriptional regulator